MSGKPVCEIKGGNERDEQMHYRKSDQLIIPEKPVKAGGGKGLACCRHKLVQVLQTES